MTENAPDWDEATKSGNFVVLVQDEMKTVVITNWRLENVEKFGEPKIELIADTLEEDGEPVKDKIFSTVSMRLKNKLRPILENKNPLEKVKISVIQIGEKYNTQYSCKEVLPEKEAPADKKELPEKEALLAPETAE